MQSPKVLVLQRGVGTARADAGLLPLKQAGFFHDGRFKDLIDVINHYNRVFNLGLTDQEKHDLIEYVKSL